MDPIASNVTLPLLQVPPTYCQYAGGPCDQDFSNARASDGLFLYGSKPVQIAQTLEATVEQLRNLRANEEWISWRNLDVTGQLIFCEVDKAIRFTQTVVADVTTLNFNLLFEIGFTIGLGKPVVPVRDTTLLANTTDFAALGILDAFGYIDFQNAKELASQLATRLPGRPLPDPPRKTYSETPLYVLRGPIGTEGTVRLMSTLKKSGLRFRMYDSDETPRLSLTEARKQVHGSVGVVAHLLDPEREHASAHNALCALVGGMALAQQKVVVLLQEEVGIPGPHPLDYRDLILGYGAPSEIPTLLEKPIRQVVESLQRANPRQILPPETALEQIDLGDPAAENEIVGLRDYFVRTAQYRRAIQGHARLVVGRKGTGKSAIFYAVRDAASSGRSRLVLDLKPEGHQFKKLREVVLSELPEGTQEHTVTAFWNYILLCEIAHRLLDEEMLHAHRDPKRLARYERLRALYLEHATSSGDDLSQRLLHQVDRLVERFGELDDGAKGRDRVTELLFSGDIRELDEAVGEYLEEKDAVWLLIDNLDKSWPTRGSSAADILILRGLLGATRKLQRQLEEQDVELKCIVFIRTDIYDHLLAETPDKGKDTVIRLDWEDPEVFREIVRRRIETSTTIEGEFEAVWRAFFDSHVGSQESFNYMIERTLMRPRDFLLFVQRAIDVALNRGHTTVAADDIRQAEASYSQDMLLMLTFEIQDTAPDLQDIVFEFQGATTRLSQKEVLAVLERRGLSAERIEQALELLVWFGFLGVTASVDSETYAYQVVYNVRQVLQPMRDGRARLVIHPAFRSALAVA